MIGRAPFLALLLSALASPVMAALHFDQLSSCESLEATQDFLRAPPVGCGPARTALEHAVAERFRYVPDARLCFLSRAPTPNLSSFDCMVLEARESRTIACLKAADPEEMTAFRDEYDARYEAIVNRYLDQASQCPVGNGDAARGPRTMVPFLVGLVARHRFNFVLPVGDRLRGSSAFVHGYADVDPDVDDGSQPAVEYLSVWVNR